MAGLPYEIIATSRPFVIVVGPGRKEFMIHTELIASMSKPLNAMVHGGMRESTDGRAEWPEVDEGTFVRFCEFAYTGDYKAAKPEPQKVTPTKPEPASEEVPQEFCPVEETAPAEVDYPAEQAYEIPGESLNVHDPRGIPTKKRGKSQKTLSKREQVWSQFANIVYDTPLPQVAEELADTDNLNFSEVFLSHARLYALADYYDIERLMTVSLKKLHLCLQRFRLKPDRADNVVGLAVYCYENTVDKGDSRDRLRILVSLYIACKVEEIWGSPYFHDILEKYGELGKDIIEHMLKRLD